MIQRSGNGGNASTKALVVPGVEGVGRKSIGVVFRNGMVMRKLKPEPRGLGMYQKLNVYRLVEVRRGSAWATKEMLVPGAKAIR